MTAYQPDAALHIVQITPTSYAKTGIIGGGERLVLYLNDALRRAAQELHLSVRTSIVALDGLGERAAKGEIVAISGTAWDPRSIQAEALIQTLKTADYVYVHQCMTEVGLFAAAHARLLGKRVFGSDAGAGEASMLRWAPDILEIYEGLHSISRYAALAFGNTSVPVHVISGPVDSDMYTPGKQPRDMHLAISVGRVMPHKGYERTIRALPPGLSLAIVGQQYDAGLLGIS